MRFEQLLFAAVCLAGSSGTLSAQIRASEFATVSQTVDGTEIKLEYSRPRLRGRGDAVFGEEVKWDEVWTPGANYATTLEVNKDIKLDGHPVAKGKYSVWIQIKKSGPWTMVLDPRSHLFHMAHPDSNANQIRYQITPGTGPSTNVLTWSFPEVRINGATMVMQWGTVQIPFRIEVTPSYDMKMTAAKASPYVGKYSYAWKMKQPGDSVPIVLTISFRDTVLVGEFKPELWEGADKIIFVPVKDDWFYPAFLEKTGEIKDVDKTMSLEFATRKSDEKQTKSFEVRGTGDALWATGQRQ